MTNTPPTVYESERFNDEISISELLLRLWAKRGLIFVLPLIFAGFTIAGLLASKTSQQTSNSFYIELNGISLSSAVKPTEEDASTSDNSNVSDTVLTRYPNGVVFSPQDLVNPTVIRLISKEKNLDPDALATNIDVQFGTPFSDGVLKEYGAALSAASRATAEEIASVNARYQRKLEATAKRGVKVTVNFIELGLSREAGRQLAESVPKVWNRVYTEQFQTLLPSSIMGLRWTDDIHDLTSTIGLQEADIQIEALAEGVNAIIADERLIGLKNSDGVTAADIRTYISRFRAIYFEPLFLAAFETDSSLTKVYERDIGVEMRKIDSEINELNARLKSLQSSRSRTYSATQTAGVDAGPSFDGGAMSQVVSLAEQASSSRYIQSTLEKRFELVEKKAVLQARLERMRPASDTSVEITSDFVSQATARYQIIVEGYTDLLYRAKDIVSAVTPAFYSTTTQPRVEGTLFSIRDLIFIALALGCGGLLGILAALIWPRRTSEA